MIDYLAPGWRDTLVHNGLDSFESIWACEADWFEPPNQRRGGWSGVVRLTLEGPQGGFRSLFLKRQQNHCRRSLAHPFSGEPTFAAEIRNILALQQAKVAALTPIYYAQRKVDGQWRAILMTEELTGFRPLDHWLSEWSAELADLAARRAMLVATAQLVRRMHRHRFVHNALHPKHLFARIDADGAVQVRVIDLEKMRRAAHPRAALRQDLDALNRRSRGPSRSDRARFLHAYFGVLSTTPALRCAWRYLARRYR